MIDMILKIWKITFGRAKERERKEIEEAELKERKERAERVRKYEYEQLEEKKIQDACSHPIEFTKFEIFDWESRTRCTCEICGYAEHAGRTVTGVWKLRTLQERLERERQADIERAIRKKQERIEMEKEKKKEKERKKIIERERDKIRKKLRRN